MDTYLKERILKEWVAGLGFSRRDAGVDRGDAPSGPRAAASVDEPGAITPLSNTGGETWDAGHVPKSESSRNPLHTFKIDWLTLVCHDKCENQKLLVEWLGREIKSEPSKLMSGHTKHSSDYEPELLCNEGDDFWVWRFPGACSHLCRYDFWLRVNELLTKPGVRANCTRIDVTMDQHCSDVIPVRYPMDVRERFLDGFFGTMAYQKHKFIANQTGDILRNIGRPVDLGIVWTNPSDETLYLGDRKYSPIYYRIYDEHGPLRWEAEVKDPYALPLAKEISAMVAAGHKLGEVIREAWIGLAKKNVPCEWWDRLGAGSVPDPVTQKDATLEGAIKAAIEQYGQIYVAVDATGNYGRFLTLCRGRLACASRTTQWRARRTLRRMREGGLDLWSNVAGMLDVPLVNS